MTENQLRSAVANWLVKYAGIKVGSAEHLNILSIYNNSNLCTRYKMTKNDAWCATSVSAVFIANGLAGAAGSGSLFECVECSCGYMIKLAQAQGIWQEADNYAPKVGDVIMYDWGDSGSGDNTAWPDHVGIVLRVDNDTTFVVIEGNISNTVGYRTMTVNGKYIRGYIIPKYADFAEPEAPKFTPVEVLPAGTYSKTCKFTGTVTTGLNMRSGPGVANGIVTVLNKNTTVEVCDVELDPATGNDWYYIKANDLYGFVNADYIATRQIFEGTVTPAGLNVRSGPGAEYTRVTTLDRGDIVEVHAETTATTGKVWYLVKEKNTDKYGYVSSVYIARI